jgi:hypothetical protein
MKLNEATLQNKNDSGIPYENFRGLSDIVVNLKKWEIF